MLRRHELCVSAAPLALVEALGECQQDPCPGRETYALVWPMCRLSSLPHLLGVRRQLRFERRRDRGLQHLQRLAVAGDQHVHREPAGRWAQQ